MSLKRTDWLHSFNAFAPLCIVSIELLYGIILSAETSIETLQNQAHREFAMLGQPDSFVSVRKVIKMYHVI